MPEEVGLRYAPTVNGVHLDLPQEIEAVPRIRISRSETAGGLATVSRPNDGVGLPDVLESYEFQLLYNCTEEEADLVEHIEILRMTAGPHDFAYWHKRFCVYTAIEGQEIIYLPRADAFGQSYIDRTADEFKAEVTVNGSAVTVSYEASVTEATVVAAGTIAISLDPEFHASAGYRTTTCKFGTALTEGDVVIVKFHPLFTVEVMDAPTRFPLPGIEDKTIFLTEVTG